MYEKYKAYLTNDNKVFITGRVATEDEKNAKLICQRIVPFSEVANVVYVRFADIEEYTQMEEKITNLIRESDGKDTMTVLCKKENVLKNMGRNNSFLADATFISKLKGLVGEENVIVKAGKI